MSTVTFLYSTAPDEKTARKIAETLIAEKLAACVNILAPMQSVYEWDGTLEQSAEIPFIVKTTDQVAPAACDRILAAHPYDCPCIAALPIDDHGSSAAFLDWIRGGVDAAATK